MGDICENMSVFDLISEFEGERIPNLVKHDIYKPVGDEEENPEERHAAMDDYVLQKLFKKNGMESLIYIYT